MMDEATLDKFIKTVENDILAEDDLSGSIAKYLLLVKKATVIYMAENSCGCFMIPEEDRSFENYIYSIVN